MSANPRCRAFGISIDGVTHATLEMRAHDPPGIAAGNAALLSRRIAAVCYNGTA
jgi:hypothetical protein